VRLSETKERRLLTKLKFKFWPAIELVPFSTPKEDEEELGTYMMPFHCECRTYGRLKEVGREDLVPKAYGYVTLTEEEEESAGCSQAYPDWDYRPVGKPPVLGIVKELVEEEEGFTFKMLSRMRRDIVELNRLGIVAMDLKTDNYRAGRIIDFSQAIVQPHPWLDWERLSPEKVKRRAMRDRIRFDYMIQQWNEQHPTQQFWRCFTSHASRWETRRTEREGTEPWLEPAAKFDAALYDWKNQPRGKTTRKTTPATESPRPVPAVSHAIKAKHNSSNKPVQERGSRPPKRPSCTLEETEDAPPLKKPRQLARPRRKAPAQTPLAQVQETQRLFEQVRKVTSSVKQTKEPCRARAPPKVSPSFMNDKENVWPVKVLPGRVRLTKKVLSLEH
jgi:hypothetical protein